MSAGIFGENFPYTNYHDLNMDWIIQIVKDFLANKTELEEQIDTKLNKPVEDPAGEPDDILYSLGNGQTEWRPLAEITQELYEFVDEWLTSHPEVTTTVQDRSITAVKLTEALEKQVINNYVTPQMFGAVGDGTTDDTQAIQDALDYAHSNGLLPVCFISKYRITETINVPERSNLFAFGRSAARHAICLDDNIVKGFNIKERCTFYNLNFDTTGSTYSDANTILYFEGSNNGDVDGVVDKCNFYRNGKAIEVVGRNLKVTASTFSHCRYGIHINMPSALRGFRGMIINSCRFHGIGEELAMNNGVLEEILISGNCAGILLDADNQIGVEQESDIQITSCLSDQSGTFVKGKAQNCLIEACYISGFAHPSIVIDGGSDSVVHPQGIGAWMINGCFMQGIQGTDGAGVTHDRPDNLITISRYGRVSINDCAFGKVKYTPVKVSKSEDVTVSGCIMYWSQSGDALISVYDGAKVSAVGNTNAGSNKYIATGNANDSTSLVISTGNRNFTTVRDPNKFHNIRPWEHAQISFTSGDIIDGIQQVPVFYVRKSDNVTLFKCEHLTGTYFTSTSYINSSGIVESIRVGATGKVFLTTTDGSARTDDTSTTLYFILPQ